MKKIIFLSLFLTANAIPSHQQQAEAKQIILDIPEEEIEIAETYVPDAEQWIKDAWRGKVNQRREALIKEEIQNSLEAGRSIPASKDDILKNGMKRMGTRKHRDAVEEAERMHERKK
jgi:hypothetical protein